MALISIFVGSVYGNAQSLAERVQSELLAQGHQVELHDGGNLIQLTKATHVLFISSTTGSGDIPDNLYPLFTQLQSQKPSLSTKKSAVIALGDSSYGDTYCGAGKQIESLLNSLNALIIEPRLDIDACEYFEPWEAAEPWLKRWQKSL